MRNLFSSISGDGGEALCDPDETNAGRLYCVIESDIDAGENTFGRTLEGQSSVAWRSADILARSKIEQSAN